MSLYPMDGSNHLPMPSKCPYLQEASNYVKLTPKHFFQDRWHSENTTSMYIISGIHIHQRSWIYYMIQICMVTIV